MKEVGDAGLELADFVTVKGGDLEVSLQGVLIDDISEKFPVNVTVSQFIDFGAVEAGGERDGSFHGFVVLVQDFDHHVCLQRQ